MKFESYDKAKWHFGAANAPTDIAPEQGATHIAFFFRWCIERAFMSKLNVEDYGDKLEEMKKSSHACRDFFMNFGDGVFSSDDLNTKGQAFAHAYYGSEKTQFAKAYATYTVDYGKWVDGHTELLNTYRDNAYFYIENSEDNYAEVRRIIDERYAQFLAMKTKK
ncbi:MAG: hypothetical protein FWC42_08400 [Proteobacteria bacterium]|nr:hypothetical protein [Pseudomonadota bacterium]